MNIVVVTGASSGIGREFAKLIAKEEVFDEMWVLARDRDKLEQLRLHINAQLRIIDGDLATSQGIAKYTALLDEYGPNVKMLVNAAGYGKFGRYDDIPTADTLGIIDLNCRALVHMTMATLPYMKNGGSIIQLASLSSYQPVPYLNMYAASKALVLSYSRSLNVELAGRGIRCMAVTPGWVRTPFFDRAEQTSKTAVTYFNKWYLPAAVAEKAMADLRRGKDVSVLGLPVKLQILGVRLMPHRLVMRIWMKQQKHRIP